MGKVDKSEKEGKPNGSLRVALAIIGGLFAVSGLSTSVVYSSIDKRIDVLQSVKAEEKVVDVQLDSINKQVVNIEKALSDMKLQLEAHRRATERGYVSRDEPQR